MNNYSIGIAHGGRIIRYIVNNDGSGSDFYIVPNLHVFNNADSGTDIHVVTDSSRSIMVGAYSRKLAKITIRADFGPRIDYYSDTVTNIQPGADLGAARNI